MGEARMYICLFIIISIYMYVVPFVLYTLMHHPVSVKKLIEPITPAKR